ncbi:erythroferrone [Hemicordylus capensis]|uniref:erythroferrone n=1 Tax=Hemicordylus capensis TaxID=884348 RepID=UPI00230336F1|nr:erythroferrone [Hemicordylus capensis]
MADCPLRFLAMGLLAVAFCAGSMENEQHGSRRSQGKKSQLNNHLTGRRPGSLSLPSSNDSETSVGKISSTDSRHAWMLLLKQSNKGVNSKKRCKNKSPKFKFGIPGPPGPSGPPGPPGGVITQEELLREFRLLLKGIIREKERINLKTCDNCPDEENRYREEENLLARITGQLLESNEHGQVEAAFYCRTRKNVSIERRSLQELQLYFIPKKGEIFQRGLGLNLTNGQYVAPLSGYYIFKATLHVVHGDHQKKSQPRARDRLRLLICVQSLCHQNISLETVSSVDGNREYFTISVNGILFLQAGQYASVFMDNATGSALTVRNGSDFSGVLLGV